MDLNFSIDYDRGEIHIIVDHYTTLSVIKEDDTTYVYKNFQKLDDEDFQKKLKDIAKILFSLEDM